MGAKQALGEGVRVNGTDVILLDFHADLPLKRIQTSRETVSRRHLRLLRARIRLRSRRV